MGRKLLLEKAHVQGIRDYDVYRREGGEWNVAHRHGDSVAE